ncbi:MAG TPA: family 43 glycosylhydrolase, partial [Flavisolibacter sp.]|nr:family 43 glycosylhydrolase [Flavisolibacter sp.]
MMNRKSNKLYKVRNIALSISFILLLFNFGATAQQLVLPGDHPDPSVVKIGNNYWASSTTSNWLPAFPLMKSKDLIHWKSEGYVFEQPPSWADYYFWAPEISYDKGKVYIYYAAHKKNGNLCVGVAKADKPEGPYTDLGPLICQEDGSIDAFSIRDENGKLYLIWKEDANSINKPTPIWARQMNEDRTALTGEKKELFRNSAKWEGNLVEGVSMMKHGKYFYTFYAASGCCGIACTYAVGVARSESLLGPWEKYDRNPVMTNNNKWVCPGHGTPVEKNGRYYFLHHGYDKETIPFTGRQGILSEFKFTKNDWVEFVKTSDTNTTTRAGITIDEFKNKKLSDNWQWSVFQNIKYKIKNATLQLDALPAPGAYIGQKITSGNYEASVRIIINASTADAGIALIGDDENMVSLFYGNNKLNLYQVKSKKEFKISEKKIGLPKQLYLKLSATK